MHATTHTQAHTQFWRKQRCKHIHSQKQTELVRDMGPYMHMGLFACMIYKLSPGLGMSVAHGHVVKYFEIDAV